MSESFKYKKVSTQRTVTNQDLDNDPQTLEKERTVFSEQLNKLGSNLGIVDVEEDEDGRGNTYILRTTSLKYLDAIKALFKDRAIQYDVDIDFYPVPQEGGPDASLRPSLRTVAVYRKALKRLKRPLPVTFFYTSLTAVAILICLFFFYKIVLS